MAGAIEPFEFDRAQSCRWIYDNVITLHEQPSSKHQASSEQQLCSKDNIISNNVNTPPEPQAELPVSSEEEGRVSAQSQADTDECSSIESEKSEKDKLPTESARRWGVEAANSQLEAAGKRLTFTWDPIEAGIALPATMTQTQVCMCALALSDSLALSLLLSLAGGPTASFTSVSVIDTAIAGLTGTLPSALTHRCSH